ncbi:YcnI family copper-binding membrane protein [Paenibacillus gansuensis]|uniref:YcnI family protein n=1 Tax=Paenibacillus gansuensis TaxID=306542 RepID=A0ABW5P7M2_9BACL
MTKLLPLCMAAMLLFAGMASAHVTVLPQETTQGSYEVFTARVPNEADNATVKVELKFPEGVEISRFESKPGWTYEAKKEGEKLTGVIWTAKEGGVLPGEFAEFRFQGKVGADAEELSWKAYQTYQDGKVVEWVGAPDADAPAPVTAVKPGTAEDDHHGAAGGGHSAEKPAAGASEADTKPAAEPASNNTATYLSIAAAALSAAALAMSLRKRK